MNPEELEKIKHLIYDTIGVKVDGREDISGPRQGLLMWFANYARQKGPRFQIRPSGLNRHLITMNFGNYAQDCLEHIRKRLNEDNLTTAQAHIDCIASLTGAFFRKKVFLRKESITPNFSMEFTMLGVRDQHDSLEITQTAKKVLVPMMACMAELIGYEEVDLEDTQGELDGTVSLVLTKRRERNPRNRLLCLKIHGKTCSVCGFKPKDTYHCAVGDILEVHHIEPLSELEKVRVYDPSKDLVPLCPNCHRAIHTRRPAYSLDELKNLMKK